MDKKKIKKVGNFLLDVLEIYIPSIFFVVLFVCFLLGVIFRYLFKNPQSWTFELSTICYVAVGVLSWGIAHRNDENVVFDMLYNSLPPKVQCVLRLVSNILIAMTAAIIIDPSVKYIMSMEGLSAQTMPIPRGVIFMPFTISFIMATVRGIYRSILDFKSLKDGDYKQNYGKKEEV